MKISGEYNYIPGFLPEKEMDGATWFLVLEGRKILLRQDTDLCFIPTRKDVEGMPLDRMDMIYIGYYDNHDCYCISVTQMPELPDGLITIELMEITKRTGNPDLFRLAGTANHLLHWQNTNRYCGRCGGKMTDKKDERAKLCPECSHVVYPRISPAVITAVFQGDRILLAHNRNFRTGFYSLIAGFVEPGETLEQSVRREIQEEVGLQVKNIRYVGSQPWSFPDSLMMAFTAEYDSGEITPDKTEITDADWYRSDELPDIPSTDSIAGRLIRWYIEQSQE